MTRGRGVGMISAKVCLELFQEFGADVDADCLQMTKALQKMAECMQLVADLHEDSVIFCLFSVYPS
jgi:hypothetical protein